MKSVLDGLKLYHGPELPGDSVNTTKRELTTGLALAPVLLLIVLLACSVMLFGADSSYGANQIALMFSAGAVALVGFRLGMGWKEIEKGLVQGVAMTVGPMLILMSVGMLIGSWILAGTIPALIYYGVQILSPSIFYAATTLICAIIAVSIGSSWTVAGTMGIGLMAIAASFNLSPAITAGAIVSGAYFGDKLSPLSDTTNLAAAATGVVSPTADRRGLCPARIDGVGPLRPMRWRDFPRPHGLVLRKRQRRAVPGVPGGEPTHLGARPAGHASWSTPGTGRGRRAAEIVYRM